MGSAGQRSIMCCVLLQVYVGWRPKAEKNHILGTQGTGHGKWKGDTACLKLGGFLGEINPEDEGLWLKTSSVKRFQDYPKTKCLLNTLCQSYIMLFLWISYLIQSLFPSKGPERHLKSFAASYSELYKYLMEWSPVGTAIIIQIVMLIRGINNAFGENSIIYFSPRE